jgi:hypothetical protein
MEKKVFVVWRSGYEEDGILGVFSTQEKAEKYISHSTTVHQGPVIEEFDLDEEPNKSAKVYHVEESFRDGKNFGMCVSCVHSIYDKTYPFCTVEHGLGYKRYVVFAVNKEEAIEIAQSKKEYIKEHPDKFPYLGKQCLFRFEKINGFPEIQYREPTYDIESGSIILPCGAIEFLGPRKD